MVILWGFYTVFYSYRGMRTAVSSEWLNLVQAYGKASGRKECFSYMKGFQGIWPIKVTRGMGEGLSVGEMQIRWLSFEAVPWKPDNFYHSVCYQWCHWYWQQSYLVQRSWKDNSGGGFTRNHEFLYNYTMQWDSTLSTHIYHKIFMTQNYHWIKWNLQYSSRHY
jgi:hypothetical protein